MPLPTLRPRPVFLLPLLLLVMLFFSTSLPVRSAPETIAAQANDGATWQRVWKGDGYLYTLVARDAQNLLGVGSEGMILSSDNGGETWRYQSPVPEHDLHDVSLVGLQAWAVGQNGTLLYSGDGGANWRQGITGFTADLFGVHFLDGNQGWLVGAGGLVGRTTDGGTTWNAQVSGVIRAVAGGAHVRRRAARRGGRG